MINNNYTLSQKLGLLLKEKGLKIATAESCTGGGLSEVLTAVAGSSAWFDRGFVTYSNEAKIEMLDVSADTLKKHGAVSEESAKEMALGAIKHSRANIAVSITGIAGPAGGSRDKPVGLVHFALATRDGKIETHHAIFTSGRKNIRRLATEYALQLAIQYCTI